MALKLFMLLLGCKPPGRHTEQHDIFFGIAETIKELVPDIDAFWPEANGKLHIDAWREVTVVDGYRIEVIDRAAERKEEVGRLFFINLGGYKKGLFDEPHFKILTVQEDKAAAIKNAKDTLFYQQVQFPGATSHIDDQYGIDVDDLYEIGEILPEYQKQKFSLRITPGGSAIEDELNLGYFKLAMLP